MCKREGFEPPLSRLTGTSPPCKGGERLWVKLLLYQEYGHLLYKGEKISPSRGTWGCPKELYYKRNNTMTILDKIVKTKKEEVQILKEKERLDFMNPILTTKTRSFRKVLSQEGLSIIAEVKRKSPSAGVISDHFNPVEIARAYERCSAKAISVLTDTDYFGGDNTFLKDIRKSIHLPVLRKDFIIDPIQIMEARRIGASAILLIAAILDLKQLKSFLKLAKELRMDCLVEVHNLAELNKVLKTDAEIIGINNRDLKSFKVDLETSLKLIKKIPDGKIKISESGIQTPDDLKVLKEAGFDGALIGESLMRMSQSEKQLKEILQCL